MHYVQRQVDVTKIANLLCLVYIVYRYLGRIIDLSNWSRPFSLVVMTFDFYPGDPVRAHASSVFPTEKISFTGQYFSFCYICGICVCSWVIKGQIMCLNTVFA